MLAAAGCTIQDELFLSFEQVLAIGEKNGVKYDRIVLENSGVAEPQNIRDAFAEAAADGHPVLSRVHLSTLVRRPLSRLTNKVVRRLDCHQACTRIKYHVETGRS